MSSAIKEECMSRLTRNEGVIEEGGLNIETLLDGLEHYFGVLEKNIVIDRDELSKFVQQIEKALQGQTAFLVKFRKEIYGLNDQNANLQYR
ncbi:MAG: hypothetical protein ABFQ53_00230 [Patescibacteria group bacterium]